MPSPLEKLLKNPLVFIKQAFQKLIIGPLKYRRKNDYQASLYWEERFKKHGMNLQAVGDEGISPEDNQKMYAEAKKIFTNVLTEHRLDFSRINILEIGCGTGFYTGILKNLGAKHYVGADITDAFFPKLKTAYPEFQFIRRDISSEKVDGKFDLIVMIDVIEHIVSDEKLQFALRNLTDALTPNGLFILAPVMPVSRKQLFYVRFWTLEEIKKILSGFSVGLGIKFREGSLVVIKAGVH